MSTHFCFEHVFRAPSIAAVFAAYFDPAHVALQDRQLEITERSVLELTDDGRSLRRHCKVTPKRQLPAIVRPLVAGSLHYLETATWWRADDQIDIEIWPSLLKRKTQPTITACYRLTRHPEGIHRRYQGCVSVDLALVGGRVERGIVAEFERSMPLAASCTQEFLDRTASYVRAHA